MFDYEGLAKLRQQVNIQIAGGEINRGLNEFKAYLDKGCYDILQPNSTLAASFTDIRKIAALAEAHGKLCSPHNWIPGVGQVATMHLAASLPNSTWLEYPYDPPAIVPEGFQGILADPVTVEKDGCVKIPEKPGFGVQLDPEKLKRYFVS